MEIKQVILKILSSNTEIGEKIHNIKEDESLLDYGMDSLQMMRTVVEIEKALDFKFCDEDLLTANFTSIGSILASVKSVLSDTENN
ncbi:acyl carrier protein [Alkaliphilus peptidifermentans]|uniref:Phosphopantetheine attachment site n=1 Tax=Alkaliphilus peptidifermentans DSM 18978 TaxID=1120976 RepID=A0A1G5K5P7_9FIRM|nr:acyl carrier protein [Alkaliphilus peptidifermentans]SCY95877.1 Phosphopantetheine attachment site [Alkaliphilus peptidifermentans DSM 18978]